MPSYESRRKALDRRQKLLEGMMGGIRAPGPGQMVGDHFVPTGIGNALLPAVQMMAGQYAQGKADEEGQQLGQERMSLLRDALERAQTQEAPDRLTTLMGSELPELQQMGMKQFESMMAPEKPESFRGLTTVMGPDGKPMLVQAGNRGTIKPVEGFGPQRDLMAVRGEVIDRNTLESMGMFGQAPAGTNVTVNNMGAAEESNFAKLLGKKNAERVDASLTVLNNQAEIQDLLGRIQQMEQQPVLRGGAARTIASLSSVASTFGFQPPENVTNVEVLDGMIQDYIKTQILAGGRGITDEDAKRLERALPDVTKSAAGARKFRMLLQESNARAQKRATQTLNVMSKRYPEVKELMPLDTTELPQPPTLPHTQGQPIQLSPENADAEYDSLPSGATFISPDGKTRRKP